MSHLSEDEILAIQLELSCHQNFKVLLEKLHRVKQQSVGKTQAQDLVRTFMMSVNSFFPCASVRVFFGGWYYEHFDYQKSLNLPPLSTEPNTLTGLVLKQQEPAYFTENHPSHQFQEELDLYFQQGVEELRIFPLVDNEELPMGLVELTTMNGKNPEYQQDLLQLTIIQLSTLLDRGKKAPETPVKNKRTPSPELLGRLKRAEDELETAQERERLFYSLTRYFRDTVRMIDAWKHLQTLTPENEIGEYDFSHHADFYFQRAFKFSELLLYSYKIRFNDHSVQLKDHDLVSLIHESMVEFTRHHQKSSINLRTEFPPGAVEAMVDQPLFHTAILYAMEHLFLQNSNRKDNNCLVIEAQTYGKSAHVRLSNEKDPLVQQLQADQFNFEEYMEAPLDEYGLNNLYLSFIKMAITNQGGTVRTEGQGAQVQAISIEIPREFLVSDQTEKEKDSEAQSGP